MKSIKTGIVAALGILALAGTAQAKIPFLNATCPTDIEVHADDGGPVYINGKEARIVSSNATYTEAKHGHITISISLSPDGSATVSYTRRNGANGICQVGDSGGSGGGGCPVDVTEADRDKYPACN